MPKFIACEVCDKNGFMLSPNGRHTECPCCGTVSIRKKINAFEIIRQFGWTTAEVVNAYYMTQIREYYKNQKNTTTLDYINRELPGRMDVYRASNPTLPEYQYKAHQWKLIQVLSKLATQK